MARTTTVGLVTAARNLFILLGFHPDACEALVVTEGLNSPRDFVFLNDERVTQICKTVRRPGGAGNGAPVSEKAEHNFGLVVKLFKYWLNTSRIVRLNAVSLALFPTVEHHAKVVDDWQNSEHEPPEISANWIKRDPNGVWDALKEWLATWRGCTGAPLAYVVRDALFPPQDPDPAGNYMTIDDELIARMPIVLSTIARTDDPDALEGSALANFDVSFKIDNVAVYDCLKKALGSTTLWIHAKGHQRTKNGREAWRSIYAHTFGQSAMNARHTANRSDIEALVYTGEKNRQNFSTYVAKHKACHIIQQNLAETGNFNDFTGLEKVNFLINGIRVPELDAALAQIHATRGTQEDFTAACTNISDFIRMRDARQGNAKPRNVSALTSGGSAGGKGKRKADDDGDRALDERARRECPHITRYYYEPEDFKKLSGLELRKLKLNQAEQHARGEYKPKGRKGGGGRRSGNGNGNGNGDGASDKVVISQLVTSISELTKTVAKAQKDVRHLKNRMDDNSDENTLFGSDSDDDPPSAVKSNRTNEALVKTGAKKKKGNR